VERSPIPTPHPSPTIPPMIEAIGPPNELPERTNERRCKWNNNVRLKSSLVDERWRYHNFGNRPLHARRGLSSVLVANHTAT
jgi:hypothetical protein